MWVPFSRPFPGNEAHNFPWGPTSRFLGVGGKKFILKKFVCFSVPYRQFLSGSFRGNPNGGLANAGLARKASIGPKRAFSGQFLLFPRGCAPWVWGAEELVLIGPEKATIGPEKSPICPEKARFSRKDFHP